MAERHPTPESVVRCALASYYALVSCLDAHIGRILEAIDTSPLRENTLVIYTSDHGEKWQDTTATGRNSASTEPGSKGAFNIPLAFR